MSPQEEIDTATMEADAQILRERLARRIGNVRNRIRRPYDDFVDLKSKVFPIQGDASDPRARASLLGSVFVVGSLVSLTVHWLTGRRSQFTAAHSASPGVDARERFDPPSSGAAGSPYTLHGLAGLALVYAGLHAGRVFAQIFSANARSSYDGGADKGSTRPHWGAGALAASQMVLTDYALAVLKNHMSGPKARAVLLLGSLMMGLAKSSQSKASA